MDYDPFIIMGKPKCFQYYFSQNRSFKKGLPAGDSAGGEVGFSFINYFVSTSCHCCLKVSRQSLEAIVRPSAEPRVEGVN